MSEKLTLREKLHAGEKPHMSKKLKKTLIVIACVIAGCGAVWGGLTIARNAQRGDVNVYAVNDFAMTNYWGDTSNTSGMVTTDKLQKIYISQSQTVKKVWVKEGDTVKKGTALVSYDSTLTQATVERAKIDYDRQAENLEVMKNELALLQKAKNKETLQAERNGLQSKLDKLIEDADKAAGYKDPVTPGFVTVEGNLGNTKDKPLYYIYTGTLTLDQTTLETLLAEKTEAYIVAFKREGDIAGGAITESWGLHLKLVNAAPDPTPGGETGGNTSSGEDTGSGQTTVTVLTNEGNGSDNNDKPAAAEKKISLELLNGMPDYPEKTREYNTKEIQDLQKKIAQIDELLDSSMTQQEINKAILEKSQSVKEQEVNLKVAKLKLDKKLAELGDGNVYAEFDGTVKTVRDPDEAYNNSEAVVELSGGGGYYVTGTLSEMDLGSVQVGDTVSISSWMTGAACEGTIVSIDDYPTNNGNNWGDGNRNASYYPFKVFVTEDANLQPNDYVDMQFQKNASADESGNTLYLESMFIRTENGKSYVMARGEDGRLEQRWVQTGRDLWGSYTQIRGGLTIDDYVAFPYGRDVTEGAKTVEATADQLYNYGV